MCNSTHALTIDIYIYTAHTSISTLALITHQSVYDSASTDCTITYIPYSYKFSRIHNFVLFHLLCLTKRNFYKLPGQDKDKSYSFCCAEQKSLKGPEKQTKNMT